MFKLIKTSALARRGSFETPHGTIQTPVFMNVATQGAIKGGLSALDLESIKCGVALCNTYHLHLRPGQDVVRQLGGLHTMMKWNAPILTDSGGFQVFSLSALRKITEQGVNFSSHIDGRKIFMGPEESMDIQTALGADIAMAFDECVENPSPYEYVKSSCERTTRWLIRCMEHLEKHSPKQILFGINQGGTYGDLRIEHMKRISELNLPGYAIGGLAVGEATETMYEILDVTLPFAPKDKPRYLMGVGTPTNIIEAVARGIDFFDCVLPARNARHGHLYTWNYGCININNEKYKTDSRPIDEQCQCPVCKNFSRAYLRHLMKAGEILALRLSVMHNLYFYNTLLEKIRETIENDTFEDFRRRYSGIIDERK